MLICIVLYPYINNHATCATLSYMLVAIDTGGTKTLISSFDREGKIGESIKFPTPKDKKEYISTLKQHLEERYGNKQVDVVVLAIPGIIKDGVAIWCQNLKWKNFDIGTALKGVLGGVPVLIENDANLAGLSETRMLDPMPTSSLYITISTGIGSGVITNGFIDPGLRHSEPGRALIEFDGRVREWESFASGRVIVDTYKKFARDIKDKRTWYQISDRISRGFLAVIPIMQPEVIIIGGSVGSYFDRYGKMLEGILKENLPPHIVCPRFVQAKHPEEAVIYGCYYYGTDYLTSQ